MEIIKDEWSGLFSQLEEKISSAGRRRLLAMLIADMYDLTVKTMGPNGENRPAEWPPLSPLYAALAHAGDRTATEVLSGHMRDSFEVEVNDSSATLSNTTSYFSKQQGGDSQKKLPARPMMPITPDGNDLTAEAKTVILARLDEYFEINS
jgi:phage gpG-like protein